MFSITLIWDLSKYHLLKHPFYQAWNQGTLEVSALQRYAKQYFKNVEAFPRYVSGMHSQCLLLNNRRVLLENLIDEEKGDENHPELWLRFAESFGKHNAAMRVAELLWAFLDNIYNSKISGALRGANC